MYTLYSKDDCQMCKQAKLLLDMKQIKYVVKMMDIDYTVEELKELAPGRTQMPVIFKDDVLIGGFMDLRKIIG